MSFELADEGLDLAPCECAGDRFAAELTLEPLALPLDLRDPSCHHGDVGVLFEKLPVASELRVALRELSAQVEYSLLSVLRLEVADRS